MFDKSKPVNVKFSNELASTFVYLILLFVKKQWILNLEMLLVRLNLKILFMNESNVYPSINKQQS